MHALHSIHFFRRCDQSALRAHPIGQHLPGKIREHHFEERLAEMRNLRSNRMAKPHGVFALPESRLVVFPQALNSQHKKELRHALRRRD